MRNLQYIVVCSEVFGLIAYFAREMLVREHLVVAGLSIAGGVCALLVLVAYYETTARNHSHELRLQQAKLENNGIDVPSEDEVEAESEAEEVGN